MSLGNWFDGDELGLLALIVGSIAFLGGLITGSIIVQLIAAGIMLFGIARYTRS